MGPGNGWSIAWFFTFFLINFSAGNPECQRYKDVHSALFKLQLPSGPLIENSPGIKPGALIACDRVCIPGLQRLQHLKKYAHSRRVKVQYSEGISKLNPTKIEICFHRNASLGLGQCLQNEWKALEKGSWTALMSPFETKFIDIRMPGMFFDSLTISVEEEFLPYRLVFLGLGLVMLMLAPVVSKSVPFYYGSAMTFGIIIVILIILFQGMKLLPTGRKSTIYVVLYGSIVGLGSVILRYVSGLVHSMLQELGFGEEMFNPVAAFLLLCVILTGAWLGYWGVRKLVLLEDGSVDIGTAQFVAWAIRIVASVMILQSSHDSFLALLTLIVGVTFTSAARHMRLTFWHSRPGGLFLRSKQHTSRRAKSSSPNHSHAEFLRRFPKEDAELLRSQGTAFKWSPYSSRMAGTPVTAPQSTASPSSRMPGLSLSAAKKTPSPSSRVYEPSFVHTPSSNSQIEEQDYYSTYHKTPERKHFSKEEWETFTKDFTRKALKELVSTPEFTEWAVDNADRIMTSPVESRYEENDLNTGIKQKHNSRSLGWFGW